MKKILKKIFILITICMLCSCSDHRLDFYRITFDNHEIVVGYDTEDMLKDIEHINNYEVDVSSKEEDPKVINYLELYIKDLDSPIVKIDDHILKDDIEEACNSLSGEVVDNYGSTCVLHKEIGDKYNVIILHGDILSDYSNEIDRIEVFYK